MSQYQARDALMGAVAACGAGAEALLQRFRPSDSDGLHRWTKAHGELVTDADIAADDAIARAIEDSGVPGDIISEESRRDRGGAPLAWLVDPLCGTAPFANGMGHWGVNIALRNEDSVEIAALTMPTLRETLTCVRGRGVSRNGQPWTAHPPSGALDQQMIGLEINGGERRARLMHDGGLDWLPGAGQITTFASVAYSLGQVCLGRLGAAVYYGIGAVHLAAGAAIAEQLGARVTDGAGAPLDWSNDEDEFPVFVAGWPESHDALLAAMGPARR